MNEYVDDGDFTYQDKTLLTHEDFARLGMALVSWLAASRMMGHTHPMNSTVYIAANQEPMSQFMRDVMLNCLFVRDEEAVARIDLLLANVGAFDVAAEGASR